MAGALLVLRSAVEQKLGRRVGIAFVVLTATQFHLPFYASRPLANTYALIPTALALAAVLRRTRPRLAIALLTFTTVQVQPTRFASSRLDRLRHGWGWQLIHHYMSSAESSSRLRQGRNCRYIRP